MMVNNVHMNSGLLDSFNTKCAPIKILINLWVAKIQFDSILIQLMLLLSTYRIFLFSIQLGDSLTKYEWPQWTLSRLEKRPWRELSYLMMVSYH